jgi:hypothetical protein
MFLSAFCRSTGILGAATPCCAQSTIEIEHRRCSKELKSVASMTGSQGSYSPPPHARMPPQSAGILARIPGWVWMADAIYLFFPLIRRR